jgi:hypothetical protein
VWPYVGVVTGSRRECGTIRGRGDGEWEEVLAYMW